MVDTFKYILIPCQMLVCLNICLSIGWFIWTGNSCGSFFMLRTGVLVWTQLVSWILSAVIWIQSIISQVKLVASCRKTKWHNATLKSFRSCRFALDIRGKTAQDTKIIYLCLNFSCWVSFRFTHVFIYLLKPC